MRFRGTAQMPWTRPSRTKRVETETRVAKAARIRCGEEASAVISMTMAAKLEAKTRVGCEAASA